MESFKSIVKRIVEKGMDLWNWFLLLFMKPSFAHVKREKFIRSTYSDSSENETKVDLALSSSPFDSYGIDVVKSKCKKLTLYYTLLVSFLSFVLTLPQEGCMVYVFCVIDFAQFQFFVFIVSQYLIMSYGIPNDCKKTEFGYTNDNDISGNLILSMIQESMPNRQKKSRLIKSAAGKVVRTFIKEGTRMVLVRLFLYSAFRQLANFLGNEFISRNSFEETLTVVVSLTCAAICSFVSFVLFYPMIGYLHKYLIKHSLNSEEINNPSFG